jgi:hypothetical protein
MSFDIKYDRNGRVISSNPEPEHITPEPVAPQQPTYEAAPEPVTEQQQEQEQSFEQEAQDEVVAEDPIEVQRRELQRRKDEISKEKSLSELRKRAEDGERIRLERDEYARVIQELKANQNQSREEEFNLNDDDLTEGRHYKKLEKELRDLRKRDVDRSAEFERQKKEAYLKQVDMMLKTQYPDFEKVVTSENIELLNTIDGNMARSIASNPDIYSQAIAAYERIKEKGIYKEDVFSSERGKAEKNLVKPRPLSSVASQKGGKSALSEANLFDQPLTPELKAELVRQMNEARGHRY